MRTFTKIIAAMTLLELLKEYSIVIPPMQRDYAHGRLNIHAESIRTTIIADLKSVLLSVLKNNDKTLQLDYLFGREIDDTFFPFDGQQRLTSLFLFFRYIIEATGKLDKYKEELLKFSYETRQSAREFSSALNENPILTYAGDTLNIKDYAWFSEAWIDDPTVEAMNVVLEEIHKQLKDHVKKINEQLGGEVDVIESLDERITFNLIMMDKKKMPSSEYITMNSSNLALTPWENFKASLVKEIFPNNKEIKLRLDSAWTNAFFREFKENYDDRLFKFFYLYISNLQIASGSHGFDESADLPERDFSCPIPYTPFERFSLNSAYLSPDDLMPLFRLLDLICKGDHVSCACLGFINELKHFSDESLALLSNSSSVKLKDRIVFYACTCFFKYLTIDIDGKTSDIQKILSHWMRVVWNIAENIDIKSDNTCKFMASIDMLATHCLEQCSTYKDFYEKLRLYVIPEGTEATFKSQLEEEKLKAVYFGDARAENIIYEAESFELCKGKLAVFIEDEGSVPSFNVETLQCKLYLLKKFYFEVSSKDSRVDKLWGIYCTVRNHFASHLTMENFEFPREPNDWKRVINHRASNEPQYNVWRKICHEYIFADKTLECDINSPDTFTDVLKLCQKDIFSKYAQIWEWGTGWIRTRKSGRTPTSYCLDRYAELEFELFHSISLGYQYRLLYDVDKQREDGSFKVTLKAQNNRHPVSLEELRGKSDECESLHQCLDKVLPNILPEATP